MMGFLAFNVQYLNQIINICGGVINVYIKSELPSLCKVILKKKK